MEFSLLKYVILVVSLNLFFIIVDSQNIDVGTPQTPRPPQPPLPPIAQHPPPPKTTSGPHSPMPPSKPGSHHFSPPPHSNVNATSSPPPPQLPLQPNHYNTLHNSSVVKDNISDKKAHTGNTGKKIGLLFIGIAGFLQICVVGFLVFKRQQLMKIKDRNENSS